MVPKCVVVFTSTRSNKVYRRFSKSLQHTFTMDLRVLLLAVLALSVVNAVKLTSDDFDAQLGGNKNVFVKFFAPWCGHCKRMAPDWDRLMDEYSGSNSVLIADVDCTEQEELCSEIGVRGYPTLKYWNAGESRGDAHDYESGRDYDSLKEFIGENLVRVCSVADPVDCSEKEVKFIDVMKTKLSEVKDQLERLEKMAEKKMAPSLKGWLNQRRNILKQLVQGDAPQ